MTQQRCNTVSKMSCRPPCKHLKDKFYRFAARGTRTTYSSRASPMCLPSFRIITSDTCSESISENDQSHKPQTTPQSPQPLILECQTVSHQRRSKSAAEVASFQSSYSWHTCHETEWVWDCKFKPKKVEIETWRWMRLEKVPYLMWSGWDGIIDDAPTSSCSFITFGLEVV